jgi:hypothetical protein
MSVSIVNMPCLATVQPSLSRSLISERWTNSHHLNIIASPQTLAISIVSAQYAATTMMDFDIDHDLTEYDVMLGTQWIS